MIRFANRPAESNGSRVCIGLATAYWGILLAQAASRERLDTLIAAVGGAGIHSTAYLLRVCEADTPLRMTGWMEREKWRPHSIPTQAKTGLEWATGDAY
jgi:hypothetical protein